MCFSPWEGKGMDVSLSFMKDARVRLGNEGIITSMNIGMK